MATIVDRPQPRPAMGGSVLGPRTIGDPDRLPGQPTNGICISRRPNQHLIMGVRLIDEGSAMDDADPRHQEPGSDRSGVPEEQPGQSGPTSPEPPESPAPETPAPEPQPPSRPSQPAG